jgi:hypothetical protein
VGIRLAVSGDAVAMDYGQVEDGLFVTSPILTTSATVTRSADIATILNVANTSWFNQAQGSLYTSAVSLALVPGTLSPHIFSINDGSIVNRVGIARRAGTNTLQIIAGNLIEFTNAAITGIKINAALSYYGNNTIGAVSELEPQTAYSIGQGPTKITFTIGGAPTGQRLWNGTIQQIWYSPVRLNEAQLKVLTK